MNKDMKEFNIDDYNFSIGPVLRTFSDKKVIDHYQFNVFLINVMTLFRNNYIKEMSFKSLKSIVEKDINDLIMYFQKTTGKKKLVILYINDYLKYIDEESLRDNNFVRLLREVLFNRLKIFQSKMPIVIYDDDNTKIVTYFNENKPFENELSKIIDASIAMPKVVMFSCIAWDFLLFKRYDGAIVESYTGRIVERKNIPLKVFKFNFIPFNQTTYYLWGDKLLFKGKLLRKNKKEFLKVADHEKIQFKSEKQLKIILIQYRIVDMDIFNKNFIQ